MTMSLIGKQREYVILILSHYILLSYITSNFQNIEWESNLIKIRRTKQMCQQDFNEILLTISNLRTAYLEQLV